MLTVIIGIKPEALRPPGITNSDGGEVGALSTSSEEFGPSANLFVVVAEDGKTVGIRCTAKVRTFHGYANLGKEDVAVFIDGKRLKLKKPEPLHRTEAFSIEAKVLDGQSLLVAGEDTPDSTFMPPELCHSTRLMLITVRMINADGSTTRSEDEVNRLASSH